MPKPSPVDGRCDTKITSTGLQGRHAQKKAASARQATLGADSWVDRAVEDWRDRVGADPEPALGEAVKTRLGAPETPGWECLYPGRCSSFGVRCHPSQSAGRLWLVTDVTTAGVSPVPAGRRVTEVVTDPGFVGDTAPVVRCSQYAGPRVSGLCTTLLLNIRLLKSHQTDAKSIF